MSSSILFLIDKMTPGGTQRHVDRLVRGLKSQEQAVSLCCIDRAGAWGERLERDGVPLFTLETSNLISRHGIGALLGLRALLREKRPDVLHCLLFTANVLGPVAARLAGTGSAVITSRRDTGFWMQPRHKRMLRWTQRWVDHVCANSQATLQARIVTDDLDPSCCSVIPNSVTSTPARPRTEARKSLDLADTTFTLLCVARLRPEKGHGMLLKALRLLANRHKDICLLLAGDGPQEQPLRALARDLDLETQVRFLGHREDVPDLLAAADAAILLSESEGSPNALLEAMAAGRPIVATDTGGIAEVVGDAGHGLLVPVNDAKAAADACARLLQDPALARTLGEAGRERAQSVFSPRQEIEAYCRLYEKVVEARGPRPQ